MTPNEIRDSILSLAVQGKLVNQRSDEGSAIELCKVISERKDWLMKHGVIKEEKPLSIITDEEIPYEIPDNWTWIRLGDYCQKVTDQVASGSFASLRENVPSLKEPNYAIMVKTADFANGFTRNLTYTTKHGYDFLENSNLYGGELILSNIGSIGKCFIVPALECKMTLAPNAVMVRLINDELRDYLYYYILSPQGYQALLTIASGTAMKKFNKTDLKKILLPIPPLAEQKRIVAKIEELLPYIDRYEQAWRKLEDFNKRFPIDMQKALLQMAISGRLVEQRPEEGTGEELYRQIQAEKQRLIKAGTIKNEKPLPEIAEDEIPYEVPESWKWVRLPSISSSCLGKMLDRQKNTGTLAPYLRNVNVRWGSFDLSDLLEMKFDDIADERFLIKKDDLVMCEGGEPGRCAIWTSDTPIHFQKACHRLRFVNSLEVTFFYYVFFLYTKHGLLNSLFTGTTIKHLTGQSLDKVVVPLPPLAEQKRIVAKLEELLPLCERLK